MTLFWVVALAVTILLYILLDGFDLGVGILFLFSREDSNRRRMLAAIAPLWDGNETWLVLAATILFGAFSRVFALVLSALYVPVIVGICALILRGVSFEFRAQATSSRAFWDAAFAAGSLVAAFVQGTALGALLGGLPVHDGQYSGGTFGWLSTFSVLCGIGLCVLYALLGTGWLIKKSEGHLRDAGYKLLPWLLLGLLALCALTLLRARFSNLRFLERWMQHPALATIPVVTALGAWVLLGGAWRRRDDRPFLLIAGIVSAAFAATAISLWPYMVPYSLTVSAAASPPESTWFMFWGAGAVALPLTLGYTLVVYRVFRGKVVETLGHEY
jgi:cytochrome bd ubiquinol oxidase subunit II